MTETIRHNLYLNGVPHVSPPPAPTVLSSVYKHGNYGRNRSPISAHSSRGVAAAHEFREDRSFFHINTIMQSKETCTIGKYQTP